MGTHESMRFDKLREKMMDFTIMAEGLAFPEGPVMMDDGSVIVVEIAAGRITRVKRDGTKQVIATPGGGPLTAPGDRERKGRPFMDGAGRRSAMPSRQGGRTGVTR